MVNLAWLGVDLSYVGSLALSMKERVISWLIGTALLIPFVNTIVWLAWQTFGNPEELFDRYCPEAEPSPPPSPQVVIHRIAVPAVGPTPPLDENQQIKTFNYTNPHGSIHLSFEDHSDRTIVKQKFEGTSVEARYNQKEELTQYHWQDIGSEFSFFLKDRAIQIQIVKTDQPLTSQTIEFTEKLPWIQQPEIGLKNFVLSPISETTFYIVVPRKLVPWGTLLEKGIAKKTIEELPGFGSSIKIEAQSVRMGYHLLKMVMWFDPKTGQLIKLIDPGLFVKRGLEFARSDLLLAPVHP